MSEKQKLRLELLSLGQRLTKLKREFALVSEVSSHMVVGRLQRSLSDYWKACKAYEREDFFKASRMVEAGRVEVEFIQALLDAETAERELGEGVFFEFGDKKDEGSNAERIDKALAGLTLEFQSIVGEVRRRAQAKREEESKT